jgi:hypothetical protein
MEYILKIINQLRKNCKTRNKINEKTVLNTKTLTLGFKYTNNKCQIYLKVFLWGPIMLVSI